MDLVKLQINAGQALPSSFIGPILGQKGINAIEFCKQFNESSSCVFPEDWLICARVYTEKRRFSMTLLYPQTVNFLKKAARIKKSSGSCTIMANVSIRWIYEIAIIKQSDERWKNITLQGACKTILGTARSMHLEVTL